MKNLIMLISTFVFILSINAQNFSSFQMLDTSASEYELLVLDEELKFVKLPNDTTVSIYDNHLNHERDIVIPIRNITEVSSKHRIIWSFINSTDKLYNLDDKIEFLITIIYQTSEYDNFTKYYIMNEDGILLFKYGNLDTTGIVYSSFISIINNRNGGSYFKINQMNTTNYLYYYLPGKLPNRDVPVLKLNYSNDTLSINHGNSVYIGDNDNQQISLSNDTIYLENGGFIYLGEFINSTNSSTYNAISLSLNPNPVTDYTTLSYTSSKEATVLIYDATGVLVDTYDAPSYLNSLTISTSSYTTGTYIVVHVDETGATSVTKLIKQ
jgi:hypothetical protein